MEERCCTTEKRKENFFFEVYCILDVYSSFAKEKWMSIGEWKSMLKSPFSSRLKRRKKKVKEICFHRDDC